MKKRDRLGRLVTEAIQMARIDAGRVHLHRNAHSVRELVENTVAGMSTVLQGRAVKMDLAENLRLVNVDGS